MTTRTTASAGSDGGRPVPGASAKAAPCRAETLRARRADAWRAAPLPQAAGGSLLRAHRHRPACKAAIDGERRALRVQQWSSVAGLQGSRPSTCRKDGPKSSLFGAGRQGMAASGAAALRFPCIVLGEAPVTVGPGDERAEAASGRGHLRASHTDREQAIAILKAAFVQGRLTKDELDARAGQTFASRTYGELAALTADLPPGLITSPRAMPARARPRPPMRKVVAGAALIIPAPAMVVAAFITGSEQVAQWAFLVMIFYLLAWMVTGAAMLDSWCQKRSRGQLPPGPIRGGRAVEGEQSSRPGNDLILCQARRAARARHRPGLGVIQRIVWSLPIRQDQRRPAHLTAAA